MTMFFDYDWRAYNRGLAGPKKVRMHPSAAKHIEPKEGTVGVSARQLTSLTQNLTVFNAYVTEEVVRTVGEIVIDVLRRSEPKVPWDTGQLRGSGRAVVLLGHSHGGGYEIDVGKGIKYQGSGEGRIDMFMDKLRGKTKARYVTGNVIYQRTGDGGVDVALWTHEDLNPYGGSRPAARQPGTGPKYLENTWTEGERAYLSELHKIVNFDNMWRDLERKYFDTGAEKRIGKVPTFFLKRRGM